MKSRRFVAPLLLLAASAAGLGCGGKPSGTVTGAVTLNGEPLKGGQVSAFDDKEEVVGRVMIVDGKYEMPNLPLGALTFTVMTHTPDGQPVTSVKPPPREGERRPPPGTKVEIKGEPEGAQKSLDPVPLKYTNQKKSELKFTVEKGTKTFDIAMTGKGEIPRVVLPAPGGGPPGGGPPGPGGPGGPPFPPGGGPPGPGGPPFPPGGPGGPPFPPKQ